jgi:hypothetical protein
VSPLRQIVRPIALVLGLVLTPLATTAQDFPDPISLERDIDFWRVYGPTERIFQNRERCRDAILGRLSSLMRNPWRANRDGFDAVFWDLFGDDFNIVGVVYFETTSSGMSRSDIWCEFAANGALSNLRLTPRLALHR